MNFECIHDHNFQPEKIPDFGNKYFTGNGYLGVRGTLEEYEKEQMAAINLSGIYDRHGCAWREPLNAPNPFYVRVEAGGQTYAIPQCVPSFHEQTLNIHSGLQSRKTQWKTPGGVLQIEAERFCSMADYHLLCMRYTVETDYDTELLLTAGIDADVWDINGPHYESVESGEWDGTRYVVGTAGESKAQVAVAHTISHSFQAQERITEFPLKFMRVLSFAAAAGQKYEIDVFSTVYTSRDGGCAFERACTAAKNAFQSGYGMVRQEHCRAWEKLWENSQVLIQGDEAAQQALSYSIYQLHCIAPRYSKSMSIPARGLSGQTYKGAVFWDTEMFMFDFFLYTEPEVAKTLLRYRVDTLEGARNKAKEYGYKGAFYAWESQEGGFEACSDFNVTDVFTGRPVKTYFRDKQVHISAAIVYAVMKYIRFTGDDAFLTQGGAEVVLECARFYRSLLVKGADSDFYEIRDVLGPDEYHERIDNNAYTNRMAKFVFRYAVQTIQTLKEKFPCIYKDLDCGHTLVEERDKFIDAMGHLYIPQPDESSGVIEQFRNYFRLEDTTPNILRGRLIHPKEYWGGSCGVASQTQVIKQADVTAMLALFSEDYSGEVLRKNWDYYEPRTEHGSSLSACMYALLACRFGQADRAYPFFLKSAQADLAGGGKQWAGSVYIGGTHPASAGGAWMTTVEGFGGVCANEDHLACSPCLPEKWESLRFPVKFRSTEYFVNITRQGCKIETKKEGSVN